MLYQIIGIVLTFFLIKALRDIKNNKEKYKAPKKGYNNISFSFNNQQTKIKNINVYPTVLTTHNIHEYWEMFTEDNIPIGVGNILIPPETDGRYYGAMTVLDSLTLGKRNEKIKEMKQRDSDTREKLVVPGFKGLNTKAMYEKGQRDPQRRNFSLYHKTHLLPFRFSMSEGDTITGIVFAGTAHLNHGDRPDKEYFVEKDEKIKRNNIIKNIYREYGEVSISCGSSYVSFFGIKDVPMGTHFSLDDFENFASDIIKKDKSNSYYAYYTWLDYSEGNDTAVPNRIYLRMKNLTNDKMILDISLENDL